MNDLSLHVIDIIQNSLKAGASLLKLIIAENLNEDSLLITIEDNGLGMSREQIEKLEDPFFTSRTTRRVGMGIPLFKQSAEQSEGSFEVVSIEGEGTRVTARFRHSHIDRPPLGDIANAFILMVSANPFVEFLFTYRYNTKEYIFDTVEVKEILDGLPVNDPKIIKILTEMIKSNIEELKITGL